MQAVSLRKVSNKFDSALQELISGTGFPKKQIEPALNIARREAKQLNSNLNLWLVYNGLNHVLNHNHDIKITQKVRGEIDRKLVDRVHKIALAKIS